MSFFVRFNGENARPVKLPAVYGKRFPRLLFAFTSWALLRSFALNVLAGSLSIKE